MLRRSKMSAWSRDLIRENTLNADNLVWPVFLNDDNYYPEEIHSMPFVRRFSIDKLLYELELLLELGLKAVMLFNATAPYKRSFMAEEATNSDSIVCGAIRAIKSNFGSKIGVIVDIALDCYTNHAHDGVIVNKEINNEITCKLLEKQALVYADSGVDVVAPSDMMDGRVKAIRSALDGRNFTNVMILSYSAKYASLLYRPFRDAVDSRYLNKDFGVELKKTYQLDPANSKDAIRAAKRDIAEGADFVMVKPSTGYLDIVYSVSKLEIPVFAYHTSGEYVSICNLSQGDESYMYEVFMESMLCMKRAGASSIITYYTPQLLKGLSEGK